VTLPRNASTNAQVKSIGRPRTSTEVAGRRKVGMMLSRLCTRNSLIALSRDLAGTVDSVPEIYISRRRACDAALGPCLVARERQRSMAALTSSESAMRRQQRLQDLLVEQIRPPDEPTEQKLGGVASPRRCGFLRAPLGLKGRSLVLLGLDVYVPVDAKPIGEPSRRSTPCPRCERHFDLASLGQSIENPVEVRGVGPAD